MADDFLYGQARQLNRNFHKNLTEAKQIVSNQNERISQLQQECADLEFGLDQYRMHHGAEKTLRLEMMAELDKVYGRDKNPFRKQAYANADEMRIPSGNRKGDVVTMADHIYLTKCADVFKQHFAATYKHVKGWKEFLHERISY